MELLYRKEKDGYWVGLIMILLIYCLFYLLFADRVDTVMIPRKWRHIIKFVTTFTVYLVGSYHLGTQKKTWMLQLWHLIHLSLLGTITCIGSYDWIFGMVSYPVKEIAASMQEFLISPMLYIAMGILQKRLCNQVQKIEN